MNAGRRARDRVQEELTGEIIEIARRQLAVVGAAGLSLRAVARDMGMASSAIYRYFPSRDNLLTRLIIEGYTALGQAITEADAARARDDYVGRFRVVCCAVRRWALAHPHEYALLYGSPVPGYQAPTTTVGPASRGARVYGAIVVDAHGAGALVPVQAGPPMSAAVFADMDRLRADVMCAVPHEIVSRALTAWVHLFGAVGFEVFGQFNNVIADQDEYFEHTVHSLAQFVGLPIQPVAGSARLTTIRIMDQLTKRP